MHRKPSGIGDQPLNIWGCFIMKYKHLRSFPLNYEIASNGNVRKRTNNGFIYFDRYHEESGTFVDIEVNGKVNKCLLAEILLLSYVGTYAIGHRIRYKDDNIHNISLENISHKKPKDDLNTKYLSKDDEQIAMWRCVSRASSANYRYLSLNQTITPNEVLRCLQVCQYRCFYCGNGLNPLRWHLDHFLPTSKGGRNEFDNLRSSCNLCNMMKSDMTYEQFVKRAYQVYKVFMYHNPDKVFNEPKILCNV